MKPAAAAALAALLSIPAAAAFDNADCKAFLTGSWTLLHEQSVEGGTMIIEAASAYNADGTFSEAMIVTPPGAPPQNIERAGTWDALPGSHPDSCLAKVTPTGEAETAIEVTIIDANTVTTANGFISRRVAR